MNDIKLVEEFEQSIYEVETIKRTICDINKSVLELAKYSPESSLLVCSTLEGLERSSIVDVINRLSFVIGDANGELFAPALDDDMEKFKIECIVNNENQKVFVYSNGTTRSFHETEMIRNGFKAVSSLNYCDGRTQVEFTFVKNAKKKNNKKNPALDVFEEEIPTIEMCAF